MLCGIISSKSITMTTMLGVSSLSWPLLTILKGIYNTTRTQNQTKRSISNEIEA
jgi:hypothetical protein